MLLQVYNPIPVYSELNLTEFNGKCVQQEVGAMAQMLFMGCRRHGGERGSDPAHAQTLGHLWGGLWVLNGSQTHFFTRSLWRGSLFNPEGNFHSPSAPPSSFPTAKSRLSEDCSLNEKRPAHEGNACLINEKGCQVIFHSGSKMEKVCVCRREGRSTLFI